MIRPLVITSLLCCGLAAAQVPQVSDKTPGQKNPDASAGSNLPQAGSPSTSKPSATKPTTVKPPASSDIKANGEIDPFLDTPPLPKSNITLIGGTVHSVDHIRDKMTVVPFGGKPMKMLFDERTHIYRDGVETTFMGIQKGDRVYVDTQLDHAAVFARNVHVVTDSHSADARGQITQVRQGVITLHDQLSGQPVTFVVDSATKVKRMNDKQKNGAGSQADLVPGALVAIQFGAGQNNRRMAREVSLIAKPGDPFRFFGQVTHLDLSRGVIAVRNIADDVTYEISFNPAVSSEAASLRVGSQVVVNAIFTGTGYRASDLSVTQARVAEPQ